MLQTVESVMNRIRYGIAALGLCLVLIILGLELGKPWNGKVVLQAFWWDASSTAFTFSILWGVLLPEDLISNGNREHITGDVPGQSGKGQDGKREKGQEGY